MTHPAARHVADTATDLAWLARNLPARLDALAARTPDGWPTGQRGSSSGGVGRPTEAAALAGLDPRSDYAAITVLAAEMRGVCLQLLAAVQAVTVEVDTGAAQRQARCSGGEGEWADPSCQRNAVTRDGLCSPCYQRKRYHTVERSGGTHGDH